MSFEAGKGEHNTYIIPGTGDDQDPITPQLDYLGLDATAWFINKQSSWFSDRLASGTLDVKLASGLEHYQVALGTFELSEGARQAPVFNRPVLPDRYFVGGPVTLSASLTGIRKDTALATILKAASSATLDVASSMVQTAGIAGPYRLLSSASDQIVTGIKRVLGDTAEKREPLFDFSGIEVSLQPNRSKVQSRTCYCIEEKSLIRAI